MKNLTSLEIEILAQELRISILEMITQAKSGHPGGSLSAVDLMAVLFFEVLRGLPPAPLSALQAATPPFERDRFILSKGHAVPALYAIFAQLGILQTAELKTLRQTGSRLQGHPDRVRLPWVEASTGSLGQGLSVAQGMALGFQKDKKPHEVFCLLGDGEIQEGQVWETALSAPKFQLSHLCAILDANNGQIDGPVSQVLPLEPLAEKWKAFGWNVIEVDGHDFGAIRAAFKQFRAWHETPLPHLQSTPPESKKPTFILARTVKGKGVSFMENQIQWHGTAPSDAEMQQAILEIQHRLMSLRSKTQL